MTIIIAAFCFIALAVVLMVLQQIQSGPSVPAELLSHDRLGDRYRPMMRLLDESDCEFIAAGRPGSTDLARFRAERRALFRIYLRNLGDDHARIVRAIRDLLVESQHDRPDLVKLLYKCQFMFAFAMISIQFKLCLHTMGVGTVDVRSLVRAVEGLQLQLQDMVFVQAVG